MPVDVLLLNYQSEQRSDDFRFELKGITENDSIQREDLGDLQEQNKVSQILHKINIEQVKPLSKKWVPAQIEGLLNYV